jgi:hypothetical protein
MSGVPASKITLSLTGREKIILLASSRVELKAICKYFFL